MHVLIDNIQIFPNPSVNVFNLKFNSREKQNIQLRILNSIGEKIISEELQQFIGEYTKKIDLTKNSKAVYFLEIETNQGILNKKLILQ